VWLCWAIFLSEVLMKSALRLESFIMSSSCVAYIFLTNRVHVMAICDGRAAFGAGPANPLYGIMSFFFTWSDALNCPFQRRTHEANEVADATPPPS
jgi:hypothetical protein